MLWLAFHWRDEPKARHGWPDPTAPRKYVGGFGRPGDAHGGAYSPDHAWKFGLARVLDGLSVLIERRGHAS